MKKPPDDDQESPMDLAAPAVGPISNIVAAPPVDQSKDVVVATTAVNLTSASAPATPPEAPQEKAIYRNLAVKSKAVYQPQFKFRRWMEGQKKIVPPGETTSISDIECGLPALRGENASVINYVTELAKVEERLERFYNGNDMIYKRHKWDAKRAKDREFLEIANSLLKVVGGNVGELRKDDNKVVIAIGLGQFRGTPGLMSVHSSFLTYFVRKVRWFEQRFGMRTVLFIKVINIEAISLLSSRQDLLDILLLA